MKKILLFLDYYYYGGIEKVIENIKDNMHEKYKFNTLTFVNKAEKDEIESLLKKDCRNFFKRNIFGLIKFKQYIKNNSFDIVHIHCYNAFGLIYANIARKYTKKVIIHSHNSQIDKDKLKIKHYINKKIQKMFSKNDYTYISCSKEAGYFCVARDTIVIPNGIDYSKYKPNEEQRKIYREKYNLSNNIVIGNVGRFEEQKNHSFIIDVFYELQKINDKYCLVLVGEGTLLKDIKEKVEKKNLKDKIIFIPYTSDIHNLINMFDIYLAPSIYEGFNITCVENQINGKLVFASNKINKIVKISNNIKFISLDKTSKQWANEMINTSKKELILDDKLNIKKFTEKIEEIYEKQKGTIYC